jgi:uncharacterized protein (TIGR03437 family)
MIPCKSAVTALVCLGALTTGLNAQNVAVLPGPFGSATSIPIYATNPLAQSTVANAPSSGAFQILGKPDRSKYYLISANTAGAITVLDSAFANPKQVGGAIAAGPSVAAMSPDGRWLLVGAGAIGYVIDTSSDAVALTAPVQGTVKDLAFSLDSATAFVLSNTSATGLLTPITLRAAGSSPTAAAPITLDDLGNAIATGPNGLLYIAIANRFETFNAQTVQKIAGDIAVTGQPQKPVFTSDGKYAFSSNPSASGTAVWQFDLQNHIIAASLPSFGATFDRLLLVNDTRIVAISSQFQAVYDVTVTQPGTMVVARTALGFTNVQSMVLSSETPARTTYVLSNDNGPTALYQADLATNTKTASVPVTAAAGQLINFLPVVQTSAAVTLQGYGALQTLAAGATSLPLVVRALNASGQPVMGVSVTFSIPAGAGVLSAATAVTNSDGYAQTYFTAPSTPGSVAVTATAAGLTPVTFTMTVPSSGGGGPGPGTPGVSILSGNGQIVPPQFPTKPLTVLVTDASGNPMPNISVTYTITQGAGAIFAGNTGTVTTDTNGQASAVFVSSLLDPSTSFTQSTIVATAPTGSVTFYATTALPYQVVIIQPDLTSGRTITGGAGQTIPGAVQVQVYATQGPGAGQAIPNVGVTLSGAGGTGTPTASCAGGTALTNTQGIATCDAVIGSVLGAGPLLLNVGGIDLQSPTISLNVNSGPPTKVTMTGSATSGTPGQQITVTARVTDANGSGLPNIPLAWQIAQGTASLSSASTATDANGAGTAIVTLGSTGGAVSVRVTAGSGPAAITQSFSLSVNVPVSNVTVVSGSGQTATTGAAFAQPLVVKVADAAGGPVNGAAITYTVTSGSATVSPGTVNTGANGQAQATVTAGATAGSVVVTASSGTSSATFTLTVVPPGPPVTTASFANAASGAPGLTPCGIATVTAPNLVPGLTTTLFGNTFVGPLQTALGGLDISVNGVAAPLFWVMNGGAAFQMPCETQPGNATVVVRVSGSTATVTVPVTQYQPGIFDTTFNGQRYAVLVHQNGSYVTLDNPAHLGEQITMFATGLGTVTPSTGTNRIGTGGQAVDAPVIVGVNNAGVRVISATYVPGSIGVYQVTFEVPSDTATGTRLNLALALADSTGNLIFAPGSFIPIAP